MDAAIQNLVLLLERTFEKGAWHGPAVKETLAGISEKQAFSRLPNTHSIIELVAHMTAWRKYILRKLNGDLTYKLTDESNFPQAQSWNHAVQELGETQDQLLAAFEALPPARLYDQVPWTEEPFTYYSILHGLIHHDLYHIGQINLLKKIPLEQTFSHPG